MIVCRQGEIQTLKWAYITDTGMGLPDTKTGARRTLYALANDIFSVAASQYVPTMRSNATRFQFLDTIPLAGPDEQRASFRVQFR